jgi:hypothetical protein
VEGKRLAEQGWASLLRTGKRARGNGPDVEVGFQAAYVLREFWWDPDPYARVAPVPPGKLDALSVILHELGHAIAFNGWRDPRDGELRRASISTFDRWVRFDGRDFTFHGPTTLAVYGRPVILARTVNNYHHVGEERGGVPFDERLRDDLMTGYHLQFARRYSITPLDQAILRDCGFLTKSSRPRQRSDAVFTRPQIDAARR